MTFLVPAILAALAALSIPIVLHLRQRDRREPLRFPSLMFLSRLPIETERRRRVTDWPLLLLRALALAALVLAFARPVQRAAADAADARRRAVVFLVDRSASMRGLGTFDAVRDTVDARLAALDPDDRAGVVFFDDAAVIGRSLTVDHDAVRATLAEAAPGDRGSRLAPAVRTALELLRDAGGSAAELVVVSDVADELLDGLAAVTRPLGVSFSVAPVPMPSANVAVIDATVAHEAAADSTARGDAARERAVVEARLVTRGLPAEREVRATLHVAGRDVETVDAIATADGALVRFAPVALADAALAAHVRLAAPDGATLDQRPADDTLHVVLDAADAVPVLIVAAGGTAARSPLAQALAVSAAPRVRLATRDASFLQDGARVAATLADTRLLILADVLPDASDVLDAIAAWRAEGGGVVLLAGATVARGESARRDALFAALDLAGIGIDGLADRGGVGGGSIASWDGVHPLFARFEATPSGLRDARLLRYPRVTTGAGIRVLARFDDGLPAFAAGGDTLAPSVFVAAPFTREDGDLPLSPAFAPLVRELVQVTARVAARPAWHVAGRDVALPPLARPALVAADGSIERLADGATLAAPSARGVFALYDGSTSGDPVLRLAVNQPATEANVSATTGEALLATLPVDSTDLRFGQAPLTDVERERRDGWWRWLIAAALVFLLGETWLATRGARARAAPRLAADLLASADR